MDSKTALGETTKRLCLQLTAKSCPNYGIAALLSKLVFHPTFRKKRAATKG